MKLSERIHNALFISQSVCPVVVAERVTARVVCLSFIVHECYVCKHTDDGINDIHQYPSICLFFIFIMVYFVYINVYALRTGTYKI